MAKRNIFVSLIGGDFLVFRGGIVKQWRFVLYLFLLIILYMSIRFGINETMLTQVKNERVIKDLRSEYTGKYAKLLYLSKKGETEKLLKEAHSTLQLPTTPPVRIKLTKDVY